MAKGAKARHAYAAEGERTQARTDTDRQTAQTEVTLPRTRGGQEANQNPTKTDPKLAKRAQDSTETPKVDPKLPKTGFFCPEDGQKQPKTAEDSTGCPGASVVVEKPRNAHVTSCCFPTVFYIAPRGPQTTS